MPRVSACERGGLDLLELLYRNNLLVHIWFAEDERQVLNVIVKRFRQEVEEAGFSGLKAESLVHWALCLTEIHAADDPDTFLHREELSTLWADMTREQYIKVRYAKRNIMAELNLATSGHGLATTDALIDSLSRLALHAAGKLKQMSSICRVRFAERAFAAEYPDAPINVLSWLAAMGVIEPGEKKYSKPVDIHTFAFQDQAYRAALLVQFDSLRKYVHGAGGSKELVRGMYSGLTSTKDASIIEAMSRWEDAAGNRVHLPKLKNSILAIDCSAWSCGDVRKIKSTIAQFPSLAPSYQAFLTKKSTALTDIAGAMIRTHPWNENQVGLGRFSHTSESKAEYVQKELERRGFTVGARTIHIHNRDSVQKHVDLMEYYLEMLKVAPFVFPCEVEDGCLIYLNGCDKAPLEQIFEQRRSRRFLASNAAASALKST